MYHSICVCFMNWFYRWAVRPDRFPTERYMFNYGYCSERLNVRMEINDFVFSAVTVHQFVVSFVTPFKSLFYVVLCSKRGSQPELTVHFMVS